MHRKTFLFTVMIVTLLLCLSLSAVSMPSDPLAGPGGIMNGTEGEESTSQNEIQQPAGESENTDPSGEGGTDVSGELNNVSNTSPPETSAGGQTLNSNETQMENEADQAGQQNQGDPASQEQQEQNVSSEPQAPSAPMVALTFDDGPYSPVTDRIIDKLVEYGGKGTFFLVGNRISSYSESLKKAHAAGFEIANHTWDHTALTTLQPLEIMRQIHDTDNAITYYTGSPSILARPVGGARNEVVDASIGKPMINWSIDTRDWSSKNAWSIADIVLNSVSDGDIVLMHDLYTATADACDIIIPELTARGYKLVTVSEMAAARGITLEAGKLYTSFRP